MSGYEITFPLYPPTGKEMPLNELCIQDKRNSCYSIDIIGVQSPFYNAESTLSKNVPNQIIKRLHLARNLGTYAYFTWEFYTISALWSLTVIEMALKQKFIEIKQGRFYELVKKNKTKNLIISYEFFELLSQGWRIKDKTFFNGSFKSLFRWAVKENYIPQDIKIHLQEVTYSFIHLFTYKIFPRKAIEDGLLKVGNSSIDDIQKLWNSLSEDKRKKYQYKNSEILELEMPKLRNKIVHPTGFDLIFIPRTAIEAYFQAVEILNYLWPK